MNAVEPTTVGIALVAPDMMHTRTAYDLAMLHTYTSEVLGHTVHMHYEGGSVIVSQRIKATRALLAAGNEWLFFMDSDMRVPMNAVGGLISHGEKIVAANCVKRKRPISPTARKRSSWIHQDGESELVYSRPDSTGLEQVETVGFGVMLIHRSVFEQLTQPWFDHVWQPNVKDPETGEAGLHSGEDIYFCARCLEAGIPIYVDHDLSKAVRHTGTYEYGHNDAETEALLVDAGAWDG